MSWQVSVEANVVMANVMPEPKLDLVRGKPV